MSHIEAYRESSLHWLSLTNLSLRCPIWNSSLSFKIHGKRKFQYFTCIPLQRSNDLSTTGSFKDFVNWNAYPTNSRNNDKCRKQLRVEQIFTWTNRCLCLNTLSSRRWAGCLKGKPASQSSFLLGLQMTNYHLIHVKRNTHDWMDNNKRVPGSFLCATHHNHSKDMSTTHDLCRCFNLRAFGLGTINLNAWKLLKCPWILAINALP